MDQEKVLREHLVNLLNGHETHITFDDAISDYDYEIIGKQTLGMPYTAWQVMEHMRITQWDILNFSISAEHVSPGYSEGYWPQSSKPSSPEAWEESIMKFRNDLEAMKNLARDPSTNLYAKIPHGTGQTILREIMVAADHNSYHLGQLLVIKKFYSSVKD